MLDITVTPSREHGRLRPPSEVPTCPRVGPRGSANAVMNEWSFAGEIKSWWDAELAIQPDWELARCEIETQTEGNQKRSDIVLRDASNEVVLAGELRPPDHAQPSPYDPDNLTNAVSKALQLGAGWAFTSDGCVLLLIAVSRPGRPLERIVDKTEMVRFQSRTQLDDAGFLSQVRAGWVEALRQVAPIVVGFSEPAGMAPDEVFIESLRALLASPVAAIRAGLDAKRQADRAFADRLIVWMVEAQGWVHDPSRWSEDIQRIAQLSAYVFTTRLMFYEALRRSQPALDKLVMPQVPARVAQSMFREWFDLARERSRDYQTLFDWDEASEFALIADEAIAGWRRVLDQLAVFDLSGLGFDIVGRIFERLIEPTERYRWGQYYTQPDVVDLMLSFAHPDGQGAVLDPAVGGGTFLVRAYERKRLRRPQATHQELLSELFGIDVSSFAATLATINFAARRLEFEDNYPQIAARSFFRVTPNSAFVSLPLPGVSLDDGAREVTIDPVASVVCNPPYVRRQELADDRLREARSVLGRDGKIKTPRTVSRLSNYHVYFWFHAAQFLAQDGRLAFITSGEWYDSDYGAALQQWLLDYFCIEAVIESQAEPWFTEARVGTVVLTARRCANERERDANLVRFVSLRRPLRSIYGSTASSEDRIVQADVLRDRVLGLPAPHGESGDLDWTVVSQAELRAVGLDG
ncbi:MAG: HsdM family class I SAM-dependent methyltransferase [Acidimicrobiales bacterium]